MARSLTISRAELLVPNHTQLTTTKNIATVWSAVGCMWLRRSLTFPNDLLREARSCSAPRHQNGTACTCPPKTSHSMRPMIGAWANMMSEPMRSRSFTFQ